VQSWKLHPFAIEPLKADFPFARTLVVVNKETTIKKTGASSNDWRYYLSSALPEQYSQSQWLQLIRQHWGGVEIRNHWRRDAQMGEDGSRSRNSTLLANIALIRNALLEVIADHLSEQSYPEFGENIEGRPARCLALLAAS